MVCRVDRLSMRLPAGGALPRRCLSPKRFSPSSVGWSRRRSRRPNPSDRLGGHRLIVSQMVTRGSCCPRNRRRTGSGRGSPRRRRFQRPWGLVASMAMTHAAKLPSAMPSDLATSARDRFELRYNAAPHAGTARGTSLHDSSGASVPGTTPRIRCPGNQVNSRGCWE